MTLTAQSVHTDNYGPNDEDREEESELALPDSEGYGLGKHEGSDNVNLEVMFKGEDAIYKRSHSAENRRALAAKGHALPDGSYPIEDAADLHPAAVLARSGHGNVSAAKALIARRAKQLGVANPLADTQKSEFEITFDILKAEPDQRVVFGVVLEPNLVDSQGDVVSKAEVEKAAHRFLEEAPFKMDIQHSGKQIPATLLESSIAKSDFVLGTTPVMAGSWLQGWRVDDLGAWQAIKDGSLTGFSMAGAGDRVPMDS